jgi:hypothetical protein
MYLSKRRENVMTRGVRSVDVKVFSSGKSDTVGDGDTQCSYVVHFARQVTRSVGRVNDNDVAYKSL